MRFYLTEKIIVLDKDEKIDDPLIAKVIKKARNKHGYKVYRGRISPETQIKGKITCDEQNPEQVVRKNRTTASDGKTQ